ncbi:MAG: Gfo/Idh/MocA family oxidoreductase [Erysipelotrichaceae bacterium]
MNIATIGTNFIVERFINATLDIKDLNVSTVYSRNTNTAIEFANKFNIKQTYTDLKLMLSDSDIDIVYVASCNDLHYIQAKEALLNDKHVICEKPFCSNLKQVIELYRIAEEHNVFIFEAITTVHLPNYKSIIKDLNSIGCIRIINANFSQYSSRYDKYLNGELSNVFTLEHSGGSLMDINIYNLHFIIGLFSVPNSLCYYPNLGFNGVDTSGILMLDYGSFKACCIGAKDSKSDNFVNIQGELGSIYVNEESSRCVSYRLINCDGEVIKNVQLNSNPLYYELLDFLSIINSNDMVEYNNLKAHSISVMELLDTARNSANIKIID